MAKDKPTVLYVDDLVMNLTLFEATFKKDYDIILSESPKEALNILQEKEVQVLVSDQRMPDMTGIELLAKIKEIDPDLGGHVRYEGEVWAAEAGEKIAEQTKVRIVAVAGTRVKVEKANTVKDERID